MNRVLLAAAFAAIACQEPVRPTHVRVAVGWQGTVHSEKGACRPAGPTPALEEVPPASGKDAPRWRALAPGDVRFQCAGAADRRVEIVPLARMAIHAPARVRVGEKASFEVTGQDSAGHALELGGQYTVELDGAIETSHARSDMDFIGPAIELGLGGSWFEGSRPGVGRIRVALGGIAAVAEVDVTGEAAP